MIVETFSSIGPAQKRPRALRPGAKDQQKNRGSADKSAAPLWHHAVWRPLPKEGSRTKEQIA